MASLALTYVEIDVDYCSLTYGVAPCTAVLGVTGTQKCFNTRSTCQSTPNFTNTPATLRFATDSGSNPTTIEAIPDLVDVTITPGRISIGEDLGQRESVSITFKDHPYSDTGTGFDKYLSTRSYNPFSQGSFWGKFRARQPYLKGRPLRLYRGFVGQALTDMECRHYIIDSYTGPGVDGKYTLVAKDILKLLDGDIAQAPAVSPGSLSADITNSATTLTLTPTGIGNSSYPASGTMAIGGSEIVTFTRSGDTVTMTARGLNGTTAVSHNAGERAQLCLVYSGADPANIVYDLMATYGGVNTAYLPLATWQTETGTFNRHLYSGIIAEPTSVRTLIQEMIVQAGLAIWWDPVAQLVNLQAVRAVAANAQTFDESLMMGDSPLSIAEQPDKRVSQVWVFYGQRNPLAQQDLPSNYRSSVVIADLTAQANWGTAAIQKIFSRWIAFGGLTTAQRIGNMQLGRYVTPPRKFMFSTLRSPSGGLVLGAGYYISNRALQNGDGSRATVPVQITSDNSKADRHDYEAEENLYVSYDSTDLLTVVIDSNVRSLNLRTLYDTLYTPPQSGNTVTFIVASGVVVGANAATGPAIDTGTWPSVAATGNRTSGSKIITGLASTTGLVHGMMVKGTGIPAGTTIDTVDSGTQITLSANATSGSGTSTSLTIYTVIVVLDIKGRVQGCGGNGSRGAIGPAGLVSPGQAGGTALYARTGIFVTVESGAKLQGGGGGGGGAGTRVYSNHNGGGGGGGAGDTVGGGGAPGGPYAQAGSNGTLDAGGAGGISWTTDGGLFQQPHSMPPYGGTGGAPGSAGAAGGNSDSAGGAGGAAGNSIDGVSYVKLTNTGTVAGPQIN